VSGCPYLLNVGIIGPEEAVFAKPYKYMCLKAGTV
jgi:hypothetical protein